MNNLPNTERKCRNVDSFLAFLLFVCLLFTAPYVRAQETRSITLNVQNETVENVFNQLGVQTGLKFFYPRNSQCSSTHLHPCFQRFFARGLGADYLASKIIFQ